MNDDRNLWRQTMTRLVREVAGLADQERSWMAGRLAAVAAVQEQMHRLFLNAGGDEVCRDCHGLCCDRAKHHLTLVNLLPYLLAGEEAPEADFARPCPFLGPAGCLFPADRRPFNCLTFLCDRVEEKLLPPQRLTFYELERQVREIYLEFDRRYAGSSLRGLLNRAGNLGSRPFLDRL